MCFQCFPCTVVAPLVPPLSQLQFTSCCLAHYLAPHLSGSRWRRFSLPRAWQCGRCAPAPTTGKASGATRSRHHSGRLWMRERRGPKRPVPQELRELRQGRPSVRLPLL